MGTLISFSGGGFKIAGLAGLIHGYLDTIETMAADEIKVISGVSAGAILTLPFALRKTHSNTLLKSIVTNANQNLILSPNPFKKCGKIKITALIRLLFKKSLTNLSVSTILRTLITKDDFFQYKNDSQYPPIIIGTVNMDTQKLETWNLKSPDIDYEMYLKIIDAACAIPILTKPVNLGYNYVDAGVRYHTITSEVLQQYPQITNVVSVYARPQQMEQYMETTNLSLQSIIGRLLNTIIVGISEKDELLEQTICKNKNATLTQLFLDYPLRKIFNFTKEELADMYQHAYMDVKNKYK